MSSNTSQTVPKTTLLKQLLSKTTKNESENKVKMEKLYTTLQRINALKKDVESIDIKIAQREEEREKLRMQNIELTVKMELTYQRANDVKKKACVLMKKCQMEKHETYKIQREIWDRNWLFLKDVDEALSSTKTGSQESNKLCKLYHERSKFHKQLSSMQGKVYALKKYKEFTEKKIADITSCIADI